MGRSKILKSLLSELPKDSVVKIGCSTCFIYAYYNNDLIEERLKRTDRKIMHQIDRLLLKNKLKGNMTLANKYRAKKRAFIPLLNRRVKEYYKSDIEDNTYIILISGTEIGEYWFIDEYAYKNKLWLDPKDRHYTKDRLDIKRLNYGY